MTSPAPPPSSLSLDDILATLMPDCSPEKRLTFYNDTVRTKGSEAAAIAYIQSMYDTTQEGRVFGPPHPPPTALVKHTDIGPLRIFYHLTPNWPGPRHLERRIPDQYLWTFYIAPRGEPQRSIMQPQDCARHGILVRIPDLYGRWRECPGGGGMPVLSNTRVRISFPESEVDGGCGGAVRTHELVFPPDPHEADIPVHYLGYDSESKTTTEEGVADDSVASLFLEELNLNSE